MSLNKDDLDKYNRAGAKIESQKETVEQLEHHEYYWYEDHHDEYCSWCSIGSDHCDDTVHPVDMQGNWVEVPLLNNTSVFKHKDTLSEEDFSLIGITERNVKSEMLSPIDYMRELARIFWKKIKTD